MAIRQKTTITMKIGSKSPSHSQSNIKVRDIDFTIDEPTERGGTNLGPTPTETLVAALIGCTNVIGHKCADALSIDIGHLDIDAECDFDRRGVTLAEKIDVPFVAIRLNIKYDGTASEQDIQKVSEELAKFCPLAIMLKQAGTTIEENWQPA